MTLAYKADNPGHNSNNWTHITYNDYFENVEKAALALLHLGVEARSSVAILAANCPEWFYIELAALRINAVVAGIYTTNSAEAVYHVLETSDASVVVVDNSQQMEKIRAIRSRLPKLKAIVQLSAPYDFEETDEKSGYYSWANLMQLDFGKGLRNELLFREEDVAANMCSLLIFTSGTVGLPKGVMVSHDAVLYVVQALNKSLTQLKPGMESCITYLPLSHIASQFFDIFLGMLNGANIYFADRNAMKGTLCETIKKVRPTWFFGVPRIFEKLIERQAKTEEEQKTLYNNARELVLKQYMDQMAGNISATLAPGWALDIVKEIKMGLGLDCLKYCFTGGASVSEELKLHFLSLDLPLVEAFGMSETCGGVTADFKRPNLQTSGQALAGVEFKIDSPDIYGEGEILIRGRCNFMGYLKEPHKTREAFTEDGFIKSGDIGQLDAGGNVYINGRIKEIIITSGGENIPPIYIEDQIKKLLPCVGNAMVVGDNRKYLTVLLTFKVRNENSIKK
uniref:long-chain-fatty-acid--CoA ligase n=1 Tax=Musca domestica TaxID=7370 RepID=A0A1I8MWU3_MUSDO